MNQHERIDPQTPDVTPAEPVRLCTATVTDRVWQALLDARRGASKPSPTGWTAEEEAAWRLYSPLLASPDQPFVFAQIGQSLDGRVATVEGDAAEISGKEGLKHLHRCRALADCVVVGATTAVQDDPRLTVRLVQGDSPARVVIDPRGRLGDDAALFNGNELRCIVVQAGDQPRPAGIETLEVAETAAGLDPSAIIDGLVARGFRRIMIEGGGTTIGRFLDAGLIDRLHIGIAPLIIGAGQPGLTTMPIARLAQARRPTTIVYGLSTDIIFDCDLGRASTSR